VREDPPLERLELLSRLEPELLDEGRARVAVRRERVGLPARAIQRQHQLAREALPQRMRPERRGELPDDLGMPAVGELAPEPPLDGGQAQLLEPRDLALGEVVEREVVERRTAPQRQRLLVAILVEQRAKAVEVELVRFDAQQVARRPRLEPAVAEQPAQPRHVAVQRRHRGGRRRLAPQRVEEPVLGDDLVRAQQQVAEQRALTPALDRERTALLHDLQRAQDPELDARSPRSERRYRTPIAIR
jgi:hypothetical protein